MAEEITPQGDVEAEGETVETTEETTEETTTVEPTQIDYEAELKREKDRADAATQKVEEMKQKGRERWEKKHGKKAPEDFDDESEDADEDEKPLTRGEFAALLDDRDRKNEKRSQEAQALEIARKNTSSESEAQAAVAFWKNRVVPTGDLSEDVLFAIGGLNRKRIVATNDELKRSLRGKDAVAANPAGTHRDAPSSSEPKLAPQDLNAIKESGFKWDGTSRLFKKSLPGGKTLFYDHKINKRWTK